MSSTWVTVSIATILAWAGAFVAARLQNAVSRRYDSSRALARLASPRGEDRALLAPSGSPPSMFARLASDRALAWRTLAIAAALAAAAAILLK